MGKSTRDDRVEMTPEEVEATLAEIRERLASADKGATPLERAKNAAAFHNHTRWYMDFLLQVVDEQRAEIERLQDLERSRLDAEHAAYVAGHYADERQ